jgi:Reverse transcriptase (RNA-dependent DNA polymerase)
MKRKSISTKWTFKKKTEEDNSIRHNARVVSSSFMQFSRRRLLIVIWTCSFTHINKGNHSNHHRAKKSNWDPKMFDVETTFLNADLDKQVFIKWPQGILNLVFITEEDKGNKCLELTKAMYGI